MGIKINQERAICQIPPDIHFGMAVPMYLYGIRLKNTKNVLVTESCFRVKKYSYFDEKGVYQVSHIDKLVSEKRSFDNAVLVMTKDGTYRYISSYSKSIYARSIVSDDYMIVAGKLSDNYYYGDARDVFEPIDLPYSTVLTKKVFSMNTKWIKPGDSAEKLHEVVQKVYIHAPKKKLYSDYERIFQSIERPDVRLCNKLFDSVAVTVCCGASTTKNDVLEYKSMVDAQVIEKLENNRQLQKLGISVNMLELSNLILTKDKRLVYLFDLKSELRTLLSACS